MEVACIAELVCDTCHGHVFISDISVLSVDQLTDLSRLSSDAICKAD